MKSETSIFSRVYKYREQVTNAKENFLTEIFAFVLENDFSVFKSFCELIEVEFDNEYYTVKTQTSHKIEDKYKRPDLEITIGNDIIILIESKVGSNERDGQLKSYNQILKTLYKNKKTFLIYLTKYFEKKNNVDKCIRWYQIYNILESENIITQQLNKYLKEENMNIDTKFTAYDIVALDNIQRTISKINEVLNGIKNELKDTFGLSKSKKTNLRNDKLAQSGEYYDNIETNNGFSIKIGLFTYNRENPMLALGIFFNRDSDEIKDKFKSIIKKDEWRFYEEHNSYTKERSIFEFMANEKEDHIIAMQNFLKEAINEIAKIKKNQRKSASKKV